MRGGGDGVERRPVSIGKFAHDRHVHPGPESVIRHERLIEAGNRPKPIEEFGGDEQPDSKCQLHAGRLAHHQESDQVSEG